MEDCGRLSRHFWQVQGMARTVGADLNAALKDGRLQRADFSQLIATCCACGQMQRCMDWMALQGPGADHPPAFCPIGQELERLNRRG